MDCVTVVPTSTLRSWWEKSKIFRIGPAAATGGATIAVEPASGAGTASPVAVIAAPSPCWSSGVTPTVGTAAPPVGRTEIGVHQRVAVRRKPRTSQEIVDQALKVALGSDSDDFQLFFRYANVSKRRAFSHWARESARPVRLRGRTDDLTGRQDSQTKQGNPGIAIRRFHRSRLLPGKPRRSRIYAKTEETLAATNPSRRCLEGKFACSLLPSHRGDETFG